VFDARPRHVFALVPTHVCVCASETETETETETKTETETETETEGKSEKGINGVKGFVACRCMLCGACRYMVCGACRCMLCGACRCMHAMVCIVIPMSHSHNDDLSCLMTVVHSHSHLSSMV